MHRMNSVLLMSMLYCTCQADLKGHLMQLGKQWGDPTVVTPELYTVPQPRDFYQQFVKPRQPVVFRGAANQSPASKLWTPEYLAEEYGDLVVRLESRSEQDSSLPVTDVGFARDTIRHFANNFKSMNAYVISQIPQPMEKDVLIPPCLACGNFAKSIQEVHLFLTAKGGKTALHRDPFSNIHCVFNGTKDWILIENKYEHLIYQSDESADEFGGFSQINVDSVDLNKFPTIKDVQHSFVTLNSGDCIFMPASYWHQVRVNGEYNTAVSIWFSRDMKVVPQDWSNCIKELYSFKPMSEVDIIWRFSGGNESLNQGHMDIHLFRAILLSQADSNHQISLTDFAKRFIGGMEGDVTAKREALVRELGNGSNHVTADHVRGLSIDQLKTLMEIFDPTDVSNTQEFEYSAIEASDIEHVVVDLLNTAGAFTRHDFVSKYTTLLGGSEVIAGQIFNAMDLKQKGRVSRSDALENFRKAVHNFTSAPRHDPSSERIWLRHLRERDEL